MRGEEKYSCYIYKQHLTKQLKSTKSVDERTLFPLPPPS